ncbi:Wiskott-Aldrich syndrome protein member 1 [Bonamia ostreae]|uniref:Wiskott-Aldrich syndrome protein member 1 n=1 Tax=Bonamia ostreae TaxID=126728 RepID=A0ABV2ANZ2_9EUKA
MATEKQVLARMADYADTLLQRATNILQNVEAATTQKQSKQRQTQKIFQHLQSISPSITNFSFSPRDSFDSYRSAANLEGDLFTAKTRPAHLRELLERADDMPDLQRMNRYRSDGRCCEKSYSDPSFQRADWIEKEIEKQKEIMARRKARGHKKKKKVQQEVVQAETVKRKVFLADGTVAFVEDENFDRLANQKAPKFEAPKVENVLPPKVPKENLLPPKVPKEKVSSEQNVLNKNVERERALNEIEEEKEKGKEKEMEKEKVLEEGFEPIRTNSAEENNFYSEDRKESANSFGSPPPFFAKKNDDLNEKVDLSEENFEDKKETDEIGNEVVTEKEIDDTPASLKGEEENELVVPKIKEEHGFAPSMEEGEKSGVAHPPPSEFLKPPPLAQVAAPSRNVAGSKVPSEAAKDRSNLLDSIRKGKALRKVKTKRSSGKAPSDDLSSSIFMVLQRRAAIIGSDSEDESSGGEWGD